MQQTHKTHTLPFVRVLFLIARMCRNALATLKKQHHADCAAVQKKLHSPTTLIVQQTLKNIQKVRSRPVRLHTRPHFHVLPTWRSEFKTVNKQN